ncbi:MAG: TetR family transcriptional regulator [Fibrobacteria bacterium]|nr:TetR family transcriptional regulator [Fibrobacteria bacterium]
MATEKDSPEDRRIQRTRDSLRKAFMELLQERGWDQIRVQDICDRANVGRSTFYNHFVDKEGLLVGGLVDLGSYIRSTYKIRPDAPRFWFVRGLCDHIFANEEMFRTMLANRTGAVIKDRFCQLAVDLARECLEEMGIDGAQRDAGANFLGGALMQVLSWYTQARRRPDLAELDALFHRLAAGIGDGVPAP